MGLNLFPSLSPSSIKLEKWTEANLQLFIFPYLFEPFFKAKFCNFQEIQVLLVCLRICCFLQIFMHDVC